MTEKQPLVSVLTPTFNGAAFVGETIESVLAQTYEPIELVVVDDGSTDETVAIVERYAKQAHGQIRLQRDNERRGPCRRRNDALALARGSVLAWLDQDDLWLPDKIRRQVEVLEERPEVGVVYTGYEAFDSHTGAPVDWRDPTIEADGDVLAQLFVEGNFVASLTAVFRRTALDRRGGRFRESDFSFGDDYYLWLSVALDWQFARIPDVLARYRRHAENESERLGRTNFHRRRIALLEEFLREFPDAKKRLGDARRRGFAKHYLAASNFERVAGNRRAQARYLGRAAALDPIRTVAATRVAEAGRRISEPAKKKAIVDPFHRLYYRGGNTTWSSTSWRGVPVQKCPFDLWIYQELLGELRPELIIECGTAYGGSAHYFASLCDLFGCGEVVTVDVAMRANRPAHERLTYLHGSSTAQEIVSEMRRRAEGCSPVLVILDSDHSRDHVLAELRLYAPLVTPGSYLVVEDTNVNGHPVLPDFGPGPWEAVQEFLAETGEFSIDSSREKHFLTFNPNGYLKKRVPANR